jgi:DNA-binding IclR family transcriptional regulator
MNGRIGTKAQKILDMIREHPGLTQAELHRACGYDKATTRYNLLMLVSLKLIEAKPYDTTWRYKAMIMEEK